ncbi:MAG: quinone-dependent dihydroorotate dehydrogenase [Pseudomonadales bacterium]|nr:quinone-dependent dihydroorotate dehydrogenase [Pseudomonadales bacterium]
MNYNTLQKLLFLLPTEISHQLSLQTINLAWRLKLAPLLAREIVHDPVTVMGIAFPNRVGLAAGMDKDGTCIDGMATLGFGAIEIGTVTPLAQKGNPKPRLFRLPDQRAIINRMGFNNFGVDAMIERISRSKYDGVLGVNIGKNKSTELADGLQDYLICMKKVYQFASYIVVNISSPNTEGLRSLQHGDHLRDLLFGLKEAHQALVTEHQRYVPLVVKISPDMNDGEVDEVIENLLQYEVDGVIVSNTTISRESVAGAKLAIEQGGLSGAPLKSKSNYVLSRVAEQVSRKMAVIGVGGIMQAEDAAEKIRLGADLVQLYSGFIYQGPDLVAQCASVIQSENLPT